MWRNFRVRDICHFFEIIQNVTIHFSQTKNDYERKSVIVRGSRVRLSETLNMKFKNWFLHFYVKLWNTTVFMCFLLLLLFFLLHEHTTQVSLKRYAVTMFFEILKTQKSPILTSMRQTIGTVFKLNNREFIVIIMEGKRIKNKTFQYYSCALFFFFA